MRKRIIYWYTLLSLLLVNCGNPSMTERKNMTEERHTNALINESSPYLLQHAHNPVDWLPWGDEALAKAKEENKPLLISIGYSACHWCHVMEHESFEDTAVANLMNEHFVCIKVDREERPDVDQVYMDAVQLMTGGGGWPLNCFALPDGRPFFGGTYFPKEKWLQILQNVSSAHKDSPEKVEDYATKLTEGVNQMELLPMQPIPEEFNTEVLETAMARWQQDFDNREGGPNRAPKFPLPNNYDLLLAYGAQTNDQELLKHVHLTLKKMAYGGIYDQVGGGFARYSVDEVWKVPHFEKMLYDNGQLLTLYANAYRQSKNPLYLDVVNETAAFIERELTAEEGAFYSALDADSEGEEGKFYVWTKDEAESMAGKNWSIIKDYYNLNGKGLWEHGNYILLRDADHKDIAKKFNLSEPELREVVNDFKQKAMSARGLRIRPGLDDKSLTSWSALASKGLTNAFLASGDDRWLKLARTNLDFLLKQQKRKDGGLWHSYKKGKSTINGYLEDYAHLIDALIRFYEASLEESYLMEARSLATYVEAHFDQSQAGHFYFKSKDDAPLVARKIELNDNVIPASNSVLADAFYRLALLYADTRLEKTAKQMLASVEASFARYPSGYSQWMTMQMKLSMPYYEVAIVGDDCAKKVGELSQSYLPMAVICGGKNEGSLPILENRKVQGKTMFYVCQSGACKLPVETAAKALAQMDR